MDCALCRACRSVDMSFLVIHGGLPRIRSKPLMCNRFACATLVMYHCQTSLRPCAARSRMDSARSRVLSIVSVEKSNVVSLALNIAELPRNTNISAMTRANSGCCTMSEGTTTSIDR